MRGRSAHTVHNYCLEMAPKDPSSLSRRRPAANAADAAAARGAAPVRKGDVKQQQQQQQQKGVRSGDPSTRVPCAKPPFTVKDIRAAIPAHCFERSFAKSSAYLLADLAVVGVLFYAATYIEVLIESPVLRSVAYLAYWITQGAFMTGLWVIGHECGHQAFSASAAVNDSIGLVVHSALLVPYFSWAISHRRHHSNTGNIDRDEVFVPRRGVDVDVDNPLLFSAPVRAVRIFLTLTIGWFLYLGMNATGNKSYPKGSWPNHFSPTSPIFQSKEAKLVVISDVALGVVLYGLWQVAQATSWLWLAKMYIVPYLIVNFWLVLITLAQHTDSAIPHYDGESWDWLRGALATVDRDYGLGNVIFHGIGNTHVAHHLFSKLPHYHALEATEAIKPVLGDYYCYDDTPIARVLWNIFAECHFVDEDPAYEHHLPGVLWWFKAFE